MVEERKFICIVCPVGCEIKAKIENGKIISIEGNQCPNGEEYVRSEIINPLRMLATTVKIESKLIRRLPVRTEKPIPKKLIFEAMKVINKVIVKPPIKVGDTVIDNLLGTGVRVIATRTILE